MILFPKTALANGAGLPPFFEVNGKLSTPNPLQLYGITAQTFLIPQDYAPENYVVNTPLRFDIDQNQLALVVPEDALKDTKYDWDYGDGTTKVSGLSNIHSYTKIGSYILVLTISVYVSGSSTPTQFIDSFLINILPNTSFNTLPRAKVKINNQMVKDPLQDRLVTNFSNSIQFDASNSSGSGIVEYLWDFGDGSTSTQKVTTHQYSSKSFKTVVLRVKDKDGFISDDFVGLENGTNSSNQTNVENNYHQIVAILSIFIIFGVALLIRFLKR